MTDVSLLEGIATTRAIRRFRPDPIPDDDLSTILWHATRAPTGSNRQPSRFIVLRSGPRARHAKALLGEAFRAGWAEKRRDDGYQEGSGVDRSSPKARMAAAMQHFVDHFEDIPVVVLACLQLGHYRADQLSSGASVYPACQNLLLSARALGYGGVLTMWHYFVEDRLREELSIPDDVAIAATIALGRPQGGHGPVRRRPLHEVVFDDGWGEQAAWAVDPPGARFAGGPRSGV
ncbi:MAG TPA: nitroreductase family protein [Acidimicrobiales bacterium]|nr:nitroreductase family protein [Acidimicrobiales bacterium]